MVSLRYGDGTCTLLPDVDEDLFAYLALLCTYDGLALTVGARDDHGLVLWVCWVKEATTEANIEEASRDAPAVGGEEKQDHPDEDEDVVVVEVNGSTSQEARCEREKKESQLAKARLRVYSWLLRDATLRDEDDHGDDDDDGHHPNDQNHHEMEGEESDEVTEDEIGMTVAGGGDAHGTSSSSSAPTSFDAAYLYQITKPTGWNREFTDPIEGLRPQLRGYQRKALAWMLYREGAPEGVLPVSGHTKGVRASGERGERACSAPNTTHGRPTAEWLPVRALGRSSALSRRPGRVLFYVHAGTGAMVLPARGPGHFSRNDTTGVDPADLPTRRVGQMDVRGGMLCDEMGLGKTVEMLACVLAHRRAVGEVQAERDAWTVAERRRAAAAKERESKKGSQPTTMIREAPRYSKHQTISSTLTEELSPMCRRPRGTSASRRNQTEKEKDVGKRERPRETPNIGMDADVACLPCVCGVRVDPRSRSTSFLTCDVCATRLHTICVVAPHRRRPARGTVVVCQECLVRRAKGLPAHEDDDPTAPLDSHSHRGGSEGKLPDPAPLLSSSSASFVSSSPGLIPSGATLIVCPAPLLPQWIAEIERHVETTALRLVVYEGQASHGNDAVAGNATVVDPHVLATSDLVLTTYEVLARETDRIAGDPRLTNGPVRGLRYRKRYKVIPTALTQVAWWRVCLDEAQTVERGTTKAAEMTRHLVSTLKWSMTGTPINRDLDDLHGHFQFLGLDQWRDAYWFKRHVTGPLLEGCPLARTRLEALLAPVSGGLVWRQAKQDVAGEIRLPPMWEHRTHLRLHAVERHFYYQQHTAVATKARETLPREALAAVAAEAEEVEAAAAAAAAATVGRNGVGEGPMSPRAVALRDEDVVVLTERSPTHPTQHWSGGAQTMFRDRLLTAREAAKLLDPLVRLRQACSHPQMAGVGGGLRRFQGRGQGRARGRLTATGGGARAGVGVGAGAGIHTNHDPNDHDADHAPLHDHPPPHRGVPIAAAAPMTMREVLVAMTTKARVEAEDALRHLVGALHGLAGLALLEEDAATAVSMYRTVLRSEARFAGLLKIDVWQRMHALYNLVDVLEGHVLPLSRNPGIGRTTRDGQYRAEADRLAQGQLLQRAQQVAVEDAAFVARVQETDRVSRPEGNDDAHLRTTDALDLDPERKPGSDTRVATATATATARGWNPGSDSPGPPALRVGPGKGRGELCHPDSMRGGWVLLALHAVERLGWGEAVVDEVLQRLYETGDRYQRHTQQNAVTIANRFHDVAGLRVVLMTEMTALRDAREEGLRQLERLRHVCRDPSPDLVRRAGSCFQCRGADMGVRGVQCEHCGGLEVTMRQWESRLFAFHVTSIVAGKEIDADAVRAGRPGRGGRGEADDEHETRGPGGRGGPGSLEVASQTIARRPSQTEEVLRWLYGVVRDKMGHLGRDASEMLREAKAHLAGLDAQRKEFLQAGALIRAQRHWLYAHDEVSMCRMRIRWREPGEVVTPGSLDALYKLGPEDVDRRRGELLHDRAWAETELTRTAGVLRYLVNLGAARDRVRKSTANKQPTRKDQDQDQDQDKDKDKEEGVGATGIAGVEVGPSPAIPKPKRSEPGMEKEGFGDENGKKVGVGDGEGDGEDREEGERPSWAVGAELPSTCPVCLVDLGTELTMTPCGHVMCTGCCMALLDRIPNNLPAIHRKITCPMCQQRVLHADIAFIEPDDDDDEEDDNDEEEEEQEEHEEHEEHEEQEKGVDGNQDRNPDPFPKVARARDKARRSHRHRRHGPRRATYTPPTDSVVLSYPHDYDHDYDHAPHPHRDGAQTGAAQSVDIADGITNLGRHPALTPHHAIYDNRVDPDRERDGGEGGLVTTRATPTPRKDHEDGDDDAREHLPNEAHVRLRGSYSTKIHAVVRRIHFILRSDVTARLLVFSKWPEALELLAHALHRNRISALVARGGRQAFAATLRSFQHGRMYRPRQALVREDLRAGSHSRVRRRRRRPSDLDQMRPSETQGDPDSKDVPSPGRERWGPYPRRNPTVGIRSLNPGSVGAGSVPFLGATGAMGPSWSAPAAPARVLLLPTARGSRGLNLIEAQHVLFLEPLLDPAEVEQAVGRVHRMGQNRVTQVHHFVVEATVEENVDALLRERRAAMRGVVMAPATQRARSGMMPTAEKGLSVLDVSRLLRDQRVTPS